MTVEILLKGTGSVTWTDAVADEFGLGILTVTSERTGDELQTFQPHQWESATIWGSDGHPFAIFRNQVKEPRSLVEGGRHGR